CKTGASTACAPAKTEAPHRSHTGQSARLRAWQRTWPTKPIEARSCSSCSISPGWELQIRDDNSPRIHARRGEVELEVTGASLPEAAGTVFARAMRSSRLDQGG